MNFNQPLDCTGCSECCQWMTFLLQPDQLDLEFFTDFYNRRGCKVAELHNGGLAVTVPSLCPYLLNDRCSIEKIKPDLCRKYDCRTDPFIRGGNYYHAEETKVQS